MYNTIKILYNKVVENKIVVEVMDDACVRCTLVPGSCDVVPTFAQIQGLSACVAAPLLLLLLLLTILPK